MGSSETIDGALATGMVGGAIETWDRLAAHLAGGWRRAVIHCRGIQRTLGDDPFRAPS